MAVFKPTKLYEKWSQVKNFMATTKFRATLSFDWYKENLPKLASKKVMAIFMNSSAFFSTSNIALDVVNSYCDCSQWVSITNKKVFQGFVSQLNLMPVYCLEQHRNTNCLNEDSKFSFKKISLIQPLFLSYYFFILCQWVVFSGVLWQWVFQPLLLVLWQWVFESAK